jgi:hypothetical protein
MPSSIVQKEYIVTWLNDCLIANRSEQITVDLAGPEAVIILLILASRRVSIVLGQAVICNRWPGGNDCDSRTTLFGSMDVYDMAAG